MPPAHRHPPGPSGLTPWGAWKRAFTLLELSIVLSIIAVIIAGTFSMGSSMVESARKVNTQQKLDAIEAALMGFRLANNRLPCPTDATITDIPANSATYGYEAANLGACTGGTPAANTSYSVTGNTNATAGTAVAEGAVPVRTLNLPDEYQVDGWGRKFAYAVWTPLTAVATSTSSPAAFINYGISPNCGAITVENAAHGYRTQAGAYALISYGPDGHGGYLKSGTRYNVGSTMTNVDELANSHYSNTGSDTGYTAAYIQKDYSTYTGDSDATHPFGHIVRFRERWQMQDAYDTYSPGGTHCLPGFRIDGVAANNWTGWNINVGDVNGDGIPDIIIGAAGASLYGTQGGSVFVVFGTKSGFPDPLPLSTLNGTNGFRLDGPGNYYAAGASLAVGDVNGDGVADIIIGGPKAGAGAAFVVFGGTTRKDGTGWTSCPCILNAAFLNGTNGFTLNGVTSSDSFGKSVKAGDVNGDGIADVIVSAWSGGRWPASGRSDIRSIWAYRHMDYSANSECGDRQTHRRRTRIPA